MKVRYSVLCLICWMLAIMTTHAQDQEKRYKRLANTFLYSENYTKALKYFLKLDSLAEGKNPKYRYNVAIAYLKTNSGKTKAVKYLEELSKFKDKIGEDYYFYLGRAYHFDYQFDNAIENYNTFLKEVNKNDERKSQVERFIETCKNGKKLMKDKIDVEIENLGPVVNTQYPEYTPLISTDESVLIFTSRREGSTGGMQTPQGEKDTLFGQYFEDIYVSINMNGEWREPLSIGESINTGVHDAAVGLSPDGKKLFIYRSDSVRWGNLYASESKYTWSKPEKLPKPINSKRWEGNASISADGKTLFISSNRKGGQGQKDLYISHKKNGKWQAPVNMGKTINTPYDEIAPFIHPDDQTLYFASQGHNSMGGFDIYMSRKIGPDKWSPPKNLGYPINSTDDDVHYYVSGDGQRGYYSSAAKEGYGDKDLYVLHLPDDFPYNPKPIVVLKGKLVAQGFQAMKTKIPRGTEIVITNNNKDEIVTTLSPSPKTGAYITPLLIGEEYTISYNSPNYKTYEKKLKVDKQYNYMELSTDVKLVPSDQSGTSAARSDTLKVVLPQK